MGDKLILKNGESITIDSMINVLEATANTEEIIEALKDLRKDKVKNALNTAIKAKRYNRMEIFQNFLNNREKSNVTKKVYTDKCKVFFDWIDRQNLHEFQVDRTIVNNYKQYLKEKGYSNNSIRLLLASVSGYFSFLEDEQYIKKSPFTHIKYPQKEYKKAIQPDIEKTIPVMNEKDYRTIIGELEQRSKLKGKTLAIQRKKESAKRLVPIVHIMAEYGLRVGDILSIQIEDGYFSYRAKGNKIMKKAIKDESIPYFKKLNKQPFKDTAKVTIQGAIHRLTVYLFTNGKIKYPYSSHDFRHFYATRLYMETKDILKVQRELGHQSINVTEVYLSGLGIE